jgi:hypothetical protein
MEKLRRMRAGARFGAGRDHFAQCANCGVVVYTSILMPDDAGRILRPRIAFVFLPHCALPHPNGTLALLTATRARSSVYLSSLLYGAFRRSAVV